MTARCDLPGARRRLGDAVAALADPQPVWIGGACRWQDALYTRLRDALQPRHQAGRRQVPGSRAPCRTDILSMVIDVDMTVALWQPDGDGAVDRLHRLRDTRWTPEDCEQIAEHTTQIRSWACKAVELLGDRPATVALRLPCPACGRSHVPGRNTAGEPIRRWALSVSEVGARCAGCDTAWPPERFGILAQLLGLPPLPVA